MKFAALIFFLPFFAIMGFMLYSLATRGIRGTFFGGKVTREVGRVKLDAPKSIDRKITVFQVKKRNNEDYIGLEMSSTARMSQSAMYFAFPADKSDELIALLQDFDSSAE